MVTSAGNSAAGTMADECGVVAQEHKNNRLKKVPSARADLITMWFVRSSICRFFLRISRGIMEMTNWEC